MKTRDTYIPLAFLLFITILMLTKNPELALIFSESWLLLGFLTLGLWDYKQASGD